MLDVSITHYAFSPVKYKWREICMYLETLSSKIHKKNLPWKFNKTYTKPIRPLRSLLKLSKKQSTEMKEDKEYIAKVPYT